MFKYHLKRNVAIMLTLALLSVNKAFAQTNEVQCTPTVNGKAVTCTVKLPEVKGSGAVLMIIAKGDTDILAEDVYAIELITEKNPLPLTFVMPDNAMGDVNQQYSVVIRNGSDAEKAFDFCYVNPDITNQIMKDLKATVKTDIESFMSNTTQGVTNIAGLAALGAYTDIYNKITENKALVWDVYYQKAAEFEKMTDSELIAYMNYSLIGGALNETGADVAELLSLLNKSFDGTEHKNMPDSQKQWITQYVSANLPISLTNTVENVFETSNIIYSFNKARYSDVDSLIENYGSKTGIANSSYYSVYQRFDATKKVKAQEKIVTALAALPANTTSEIVSVFETAVSEVSKLVFGQGGSGGGGSSGGSGGGSSSGGNSGVPVYSTTELVNSSNPFDDINTVAWAKEAIIALNEKNVISGMGNKKFCPQEMVTREQMVKMILLASGFTVLDVESGFSDVDSKEWYAPYIGNAVKQGIVLGIDDVTFGIGKKVTRQDAVVMIDRAMEKINRTKDAVREYSAFADDAEINAYAKEAIENLYMAGIVNGKDNNSFAPKDTCTRAEAAKMIYDAFIK